MPIHIILFSFIIFIIVIQIILRRSSTGFEEKQKEYLEKVKEADEHIVNEPIDLPYVTPDISNLPITEYSDNDKYKKLIRKQKTVISKSSLIMIDLPDNLSNIDLKLAYGSNNFDKITLYEEHFNGYHRALMEWSNELIRCEKKEDALKVLEHAIDFGSNLSNVYKTLSDLYSEKNNTALLKSLYDKASQAKILLKEQTLEYINSKF